MSGSFFGDGFGQADDPIARERAAFLAQGTSNGGDLDARLESLALHDNLGDRLEEDLDDVNDQTFDADVGDIAGQEFDFYQNTLANQSKVPGHALTMQFPGTSVAPMASQMPTETRVRRGLTLAELEAQMLQRATPAPQTTQSLLKTLTAAPEVVAQRKEARETRMMELSRYDNMMTRHDKDYIIRIQISQLLTDDPAADDFYCHMYQLSRGVRLGPSDTQQNSQQQHQQQTGQHQQQHQQQQSQADGQQNEQSSEQQAEQGEQVQQQVQRSADSPQTGGESPAGVRHHFARQHRSNTQSSMARMQQQVQRIVNEARRRPKAAHVAPEGALGKISVNSARNPKQVIQVARQHAGSVSTHDHQHSPLPGDLGGIFAGLGDARNPAIERRKTLRSIESVYNAVLRMEQLMREQVRLPANADHPAVQAWLAQYAAAKDIAWNEIEAAQPISSTYPHALVRFLSFAKGKRIIPRLVHHLSIDQVLALTTTIIANFESLDVCRFATYNAGAAAAKQREETDLFMQAVMPPALAFLADTSLQIVNGLFALFMERNNVAWVARTKPALGFLSMFLGRTEMLKQSMQYQSTDSSELYQAAELYNHLFNSLCGGFVSIFPPVQQQIDLQQPAMGLMEDVHAWQFLATLAISASVEQQHVLVAEVREKVLEKVQIANSGRVPVEIAAALTANVNLFLNALGLDASQVAM
ncbi:DNA topoisomerase 2-associated protein pat1 [Linderina macrospora]|uniref:DNA topoisomerase 2-associated protein pat1 n=1 Tax=Linderina macrospora TaxID=4868 RepID=A0ACC1J9M1_9FUNG|nr:DNA topoisomerase 2-associated protein pat1 [Linderina macrospora]